MLISLDSIINRRAIFVLGHLLYFSAIVILNNPLVFIETQTRFILFTGAILLGSGFIFFLGKPIRETPKIRYVFLLVLLVVAGFRINFVNSLENTTTNTQIIQVTLTVFSIFCSYLISSKFDIRLSKLVIMGSGIVSFFPIFFSRNEIFDYELKDTFTLGVLTYDSYQTVSQIIGMMVICVLSFVLDRGRLSLVSVPLSLLIIIGLYTMTLSPARGESVALVLAMSMYFISGGRWFLIALAAILAINFGGMISDSVLLERLSGVATGDFGERDYLFSLALGQAFSGGREFLFGGGLNYFQYYNFLPLEMYPHNFILEGLVSGGVLLLLSLIAVYILPIPVALKRASSLDNGRFLLCFMIYIAVIYSKSGTLNSMWGLGIYTCFFIAAVSREFVAHERGDVRVAGEGQR